MTFNIKILVKSKEITYQMKQANLDTNTLLVHNCWILNTNPKIACTSQYFKKTMCAKRANYEWVNNNQYNDYILDLCVKQKSETFSHFVHSAKHLPDCS